MPCKLFSVAQLTTTPLSREVLVRHFQLPGPVIPDRRSIRRSLPRWNECLQRLIVSERDAILEANHLYRQTFADKGQLSLPPARRVAILTCMDARLDPAAFAGLKEGDAHVIRNAGGRASDDAIRSLVISYKLLATQEWFVIHHSNCGMELFTDATIRSLLASSFETAVLGVNGFTDVGEGPGSGSAAFINWLTISDLRQSVIDDVRRIREHPLVPGRIPIHGFIYQVETGELIEVAEATAIGLAR